MKKLFFIASVIGIGLSSILTQLVLLREFMSVFFGNELVFGVILSEWLLLTGIGSYLGKISRNIKRKTETFGVLQMFVGILPLILVWFVRGLRTWLLRPGEAANLWIVFSSSLLLLLPYCMASGFLLTLACSMFPEKGAKKIGSIYFIDNIGDILGGVTFTFLLIFLMNSFEILITALILNMVLAFLLVWYENRKLSVMIGGVFIFSLCLLFSNNLDVQSIKFMFPGQEIILHEDSPYGSIVVTRTDSQLNFFENGLPWFSTQDIISREETIHYGTVQIGKYKKILLISGGISGTLEEIKKYEPERIDYVELDPKVLDIGKKLGLLSEKSYASDGRFFVKHSKKKYDLIIIDLPDPENIQINRFYTVEFFSEAKRILEEDGVVSLSLSSGENYMNKEEVLLNSIVYNTLKSVFKNVIIIPGEKNYFLASDSELTYNISSKIKKLNISTIYVNKNYLQAKLTKDRIEYVKNSIIKTEINTDFNPKACFYYILLWLRQFGSLEILGLIFLIPCLFLGLKKPGALESAILTTGFAASGLEIILLLGFQSLYGYVYSSMGLIVTGFMLGTATGSWYANKKLRVLGKKSIVGIEILIFIFSISLPWMMLVFQETEWIFIGLSIFTGWFTGMEFPLISKLHLKRNVERTAGNLYACDLIGGCLGALFTGIIFVPLLGIVTTSFIIGVMNLITGVWVKRSVH